MRNQMIVYGFEVDWAIRNGCFWCIFKMDHQTEKWTTEKNGFRAAKRVHKIKYINNTRNWFIWITAFHCFTTGKLNEQIFYISWYRYKFAWFILAFLMFAIAIVMYTCLTHFIETLCCCCGCCCSFFSAIAYSLQAFRIYYYGIHFFSLNVFVASIHIQIEYYYSIDF